MSFQMTLPFSTNTLIIFLLCLGIFFSLSTQEFFRGQGKIKVGTGMEIMKPESSKIIDG
ncbi:unknown [Prevotella sp. CAG:604]|nr:unknown [Prevotella sp. CAG:604]